jgi:hypothetical protein
MTLARHDSSQSLKLPGNRRMMGVSAGRFLSRLDLADFAENPGWTRVDLRPQPMD